MKCSIRFFPLTSFAIVMGLSGLAIVFSKFYHLQWLPKIFFDIMLFATLAIFLAVLFIYALKTIKAFDEVKKDFRHRIRLNFFSAISISFLLMSISFLSFWPFLALVFWWIGLLLHTFLMLHTISFWIQHNYEIQFMNPAWFIPVVGNILIPVAGVEFMPAAFNYFYFGAGFFFWLVLFIIFLNRAIFHHQLPQKFIPTLFILIAPPAVGFISYMRITQSWDNLAIMMLFMAYFFVLLLIFLFKSFKKLHFYISWWAFTFPLDALTIASVVAYQVTLFEIFKIIAFVMFGITIITIAFVSWKTIVAFRNNKICIEEDN